MSFFSSRLPDARLLAPPPRLFDIIHLRYFILRQLLCGLCAQRKIQMQSVQNVPTKKEKKSGIAVFDLDHIITHQSGTVNKSHMGSQQVAC